MRLKNFFEQAEARMALCSGDYSLLGSIESAINLIDKSLTNGGPLLVCENGGSASDAEHITGELVGRFLRERPALNAICLSSNAAVLTAWANDYDYESIFARQVEAHGNTESVLWGISTSGNSKNVIKAFEKAKEIGTKTIALTGQGGGKLAALSDVLIAVPIKHTPHIQEAHVCIYHYICQEVESRFSTI